MAAIEQLDFSGLDALVPRPPESLDFGGLDALVPAPPESLDFSGLEAITPSAEKPKERPAPKDLTDILGGTIDKMIRAFETPRQQVNPLSNERAREMLEAQLLPGSPERTMFIKQQMEANPPGFVAELRKGFAAGLIGSNPKMVGHALEATGILLNSPTLETQGLSVADYGINELKQMQPRVGSVAQIRRPSDVPAFVGSSMGQGLGTTAPSVITGSIAAAAFANPFLGLMVGAFGASYIPNWGDVYGSAKEDKDIAAKLKAGELSKQTIAATSMVAAVPIALLDAASLTTFLGQAFQRAKADLMRRVVRGMATGAITEGSTEGTQQIFSQWAQDWLGAEKDTHQKLIEFADNFFRGLFAGGVIGGGAAALQRPKTEPEPTFRVPPGLEIGPRVAPAPGAVPQARERQTPTLQARIVQPVQAQPSGTETVTYPYITPEALYEWEAAPARILPAEQIPGGAALRAAAGEAIAPEAVPEAQAEEAFPLELPVVPEGQRWDGRSISEPEEVPKPRVQSLLQRIIEMGGIDPSYAQDLTGESKLFTKGVPGGLFRRGSWRGGTGTGLDDIATRLAAEGWGIDTSDADGGVAQLSEMIQAELRGEKQYSMADTERMTAWEQDQRRMQAALDLADAERAEPYVGRDAFDELGDFVPPDEAETTPEDTQIAGLYAQLADLDESVAERLAIEASNYTQAENIRRLTDAITEAQQGVAPGRPRMGEADEVLALEAETGEAPGERAEEGAEPWERDAGEQDDSVRFATPYERILAKQRSLEGMIAAVRDPETGIVYTGRWHEAAINKAPSDVRVRLRRLITERGEDPNHVGFIMDGEFATRAEVERELNRKYAAPRFTRRYIEREKLVREAVTEIAKQLVPQAHVRFARNLTIAMIHDAGSVPEGTQVDEMASGAFSGRENVIVFSLTHGERGTLPHEAIHWLRANQFFTPQEWRLLERQARREWNEAYGLTDSEEGVAYAFGDWHAGDLAVGRDIAKLFNRLREFFERLGNALRGLGFQTPADVFERIASGEVGARTVKEGVIQTETGQRFSLPRWRQGLRFPATPAQGNAVLQDLEASTRSARRRRRGFIFDQSLLAAFLSTPRNAAAWHQAAAPVYDLQVRQWRERDRLISEFTRDARAYLEASPEDAAVVNKLLEEGRLTSREMLPGKQMSVVFQAQGAALSTPGEQLTVTEGQKALYWAVRRMYRRALNEFRDAFLQEHDLPAGLTPEQVLERIGAAPSAMSMDLAGLAIMTPQSLTAARDLETRMASLKAQWDFRRNELQWVARILKQIDDARRSGYVPFTRFGDIGITVRDRSDTSTDPRGRLIAFPTAETDFLGRLVQHTIARGDIMRAPGVRQMVEETKRRYAGRGYVISEAFQMPRGEMPKQVSLAEVGILASHARIDPQTWSEISEQLDRAQATQSFRAHFIEAANIAGYSTDFQRATEAYIISISSYIAQRKFRKRMQQALSNINLDRLHARLYKSMNDYVNYANTPAEEFAFLRQVNFLYLMTGPATSFVNWTQVQLVTVPWAAQFSNPARVEGEFGIAFKDTMKMLTVGEGFSMFSADKAPDDIREQVHRWIDDGEVLPLITLEAMGAARTRKVIIGKISSKAQTAYEIAALAFTTTERANKLAAMIMLYRLASKDPGVRLKFEQQMAKNQLAKLQVIGLWDANAQRSGGEAAARNLDTWADAFARFGNADTNMVAGKLNRARVMRGPGALLLQMMNFSWGMMELFLRLAIQSGGPGVAAVMLMMLFFSILSGFPRGLPFAENIRKFLEFAIKLLTGVDRDLYWEAQEILAEWFGSHRAAEAVLMGASWGLDEENPLSVELQRFGFGKLLPENPLDFLGVTSGLIERMGDAIQQNRWGNSQLALAEAFPKVAGDPLTGRSWGEIGMRRKSTNEVVIPPEEVTIVDQIKKGLGFTPVKKARAERYLRLEQRLKAQADVVKDAFAQRQDMLFAERERALRVDDRVRGLAAEEQIKRLDEDINRWNSSVPEHMMFNRKGANVVAGLHQEIEGLRGLKKRTPKLARAEIERIWRIYGSTRQ